MELSIAQVICAGRGEKVELESVLYFNLKGKKGRKNARKWLQTGRVDLQSVRRKSLSSWKSGKLSQLSGDWISRAASMSMAYRARKFSACSTMRSVHHANAWRDSMRKEREGGGGHMVNVTLQG